MKKNTKFIPKLHKGERVWHFIILALVILAPIAIVYTSAMLSSSNYEVEKLKDQIEQQENVNSSLSMQVDELASLSNIQTIAKEYGLSYNNDNIVVIK